MEGSVPRKMAKKREIEDLPWCAVGERLGSSQAWLSVEPVGLSGLGWAVESFLLFREMSD